VAGWALPGREFHPLDEHGFVWAHAGLWLIFAAASLWLSFQRRKFKSRVPDVGFAEAEPWSGADSLSTLKDSLQ
jgi:hypothetical protein